MMCLEALLPRELPLRPIVCWLDAATATTSSPQDSLVSPNGPVVALRVGGGSGRCDRAARRDGHAHCLTRSSCRDPTAEP